jgi:hypothetical protein
VHWIPEDTFDAIVRELHTNPSHRLGIAEEDRRDDQGAVPANRRTSDEKADDEYHEKERPLPDDRYRTRRSGRDLQEQWARTAGIVDANQESVWCAPSILSERK